MKKRDIDQQVFTWYDFEEVASDQGNPLPFLPFIGVKGNDQKIDPNEKCRPQDDSQNA